MSGAAVSVKDNIEVAGWPLLLGVQADAPASTRTAVAVQRLLDAGAALVGQTNLPPYGGGIDDVGPLHGELAWAVAGVLERALAGYVAP